MNDPKPSDRIEREYADIFTDAARGAIRALAPLDRTR